MYEDFGERLCRIREERGLTQESLGKKIGKEHSSICKYESGAMKPTLDTAIALSEILNVSLDYLFGTERLSTVSTIGLNESQKDIVIKITEQLRLKNSCNIKEITDEQYRTLGQLLAEFNK